MTAVFDSASRPSRISRGLGARAGGFALAGAAAVLALAPLVSLIVIALHADADIWPHLAAYVLPHAIAQTLMLLAGVAALTAIIGVGTAWLVTTFAFPGRDALTWLLPLPLAVPTYIVAYVYADMLHPWLDLRSLPGAIGVFGAVLYPYVYLATRAVFQTQSAFFLEAARVAGARPWALARHITLPLARPAIAVGLALALLETLNDIGASEYLGVQTLTLSIFTTWLNRGSLPGAAQIACVMLIIIAGLIWLERQGRRQRSYASPSQKPLPAKRIRLHGVARIAALCACALPVIVGFLIPFVVLAREVIVRRLLVEFDTSLIGHAVTTVVFSASATAIVLVIGFGAVAALRLVRHPFIAGCVQVASIGYAIPGTVLALGLLTPLVAVDDAINAVTRAVAGVEVGLVVAGSGAAVVIAYVVRFMAIAIGFAQAGLGRVSTEFDDSARIAGAAPVTVVRTIYLPLARPAIWGAALLVFIDCMKELSATLLLRPLNVETLSTYLYQYATRGNFEAGALAALLIVAVGILPVLRIARHADRVIQAAAPAEPA